MTPVFGAAAAQRALALTLAMRRCARHLPRKRGRSYVGGGRLCWRGGLPGLGTGFGPGSGGLRPPASVAARSLALVVVLGASMAPVTAVLLPEVPVAAGG